MPIEKKTIQNCSGQQLVDLVTEWTGTKWIEQQGKWEEPPTIDGVARVDDKKWNAWIDYQAGLHLSHYGRHVDARACYAKVMKNPEAAEMLPEIKMSLASSHLHSYYDLKIGEGHSFYDEDEIRSYQYTNYHLAMSAELGCASAQYHLAETYFCGRHCVVHGSERLDIKKDSSKAILYYSRAVAQDFERAKDKMKNSVTGIGNVNVYNDATPLTKGEILEIIDALASKKVRILNTKSHLIGDLVAVSSDKLNAEDVKVIESTLSTALLAAGIDNPSESKSIKIIRKCINGKEAVIDAAAKEKADRDGVTVSGARGGGEDAAHSPSRRNILNRRDRVTMLRCALRGGDGSAAVNTEARDQDVVREYGVAGDESDDEDLPSPSRGKNVGRRLGCASPHGRGSK